MAGHRPASRAAEGDMRQRRFPRTPGAVRKPSRYERVGWASGGPGAYLKRTIFPAHWKGRANLLVPLRVAPLATELPRSPAIDGPELSRLQERGRGSSGRHIGAEAVVTGKFPHDLHRSMDGDADSSTPSTTNVRQLIDEARQENDPATREMRFLEAQLRLEEDQLKLLTRVERVSSALEKDSRILIVLTIALLVETVVEALVFYFIR